MKRILAVALSILLLLPFCFTAKAETRIPSRTINLVYDDSGSMIDGEDETPVYVDAWCQAKYALEVFVGMLGENDTLNIYYMSQYCRGDMPAPLITLNGSEDAKKTESNVKKIHSTITDAIGTPFSAVEKAYADLKAVNTDERWLVVLTDGKFRDKENNSMDKDAVESYYEDCVSDDKTSVMMLSMGSFAEEITPNPDNRIYFEKAKESKEIPSKLTDICNRIFQNNALPPIDNLENANISFNVPMSQLIVFAQGKNVKIDGVTAADGKNFSPSSNVRVKYSDVATNYEAYKGKPIIVADNLNGCVATFNTDFEPGEYKLNVSGADTVEVYYKPNVSIAAYLYDFNNEEVTEKDNIITGTYRLELGFVNGTNGEKVTDTSLLGKIDFAANIVNKTIDGESIEIKANSGDMIAVKEGSLDVHAEAKFLDYNTVGTDLQPFTVYSSNRLVFSFDKKPAYNLTTNGFANADEPIVLNVKLDNTEEVRELTQEQWDLLENITVSTTADLGAFRIEKADQIGVFNVYPSLKDDNPMITATGKIPIKIEGTVKQGLSTAIGKAEDEFDISDSISAFDRFKDWLKDNWLKLTICILLLLLILGYIPPFKKYLPKKLKKRPFIDCRANKVGVHNTQSHGKYKKNLSSTLIPYKAETGLVVFSPSPHKKTAKLRAAGGSGIYITNTKAFAGKPEFTFNGMAIEEGKTKPCRISSGSTISLQTTNFTYTCYLNR